MIVRDTAIINVTNAGQQVSSIAASFNSDAIDLANYVEAIAFINTTAHAGTNPTLDCKVQYSSDYNPSNPSAAHWADSGDSFTQITTTDGAFFKKLSANFGRWVRLVFTLGGTGSPSYTVTPQIVAKS